MTARDHARRSAQRFGNEREIADPGPSLPDRLATARERKGVDLVRAERETKIRVRYLSALERGDYRDLPGAVYTKGFLRNYAIYLGLDPEDVLRQWRRERGEQTAPEAVIVPPRPLEEPKRPLHFSPSVVVAALLTAGVVLFFVYLGSQLLRYSKPPDLTVTTPATAVLNVDENATTYRLAGTTSPGSIVTVTAAGRAELTATALASGEWSIQVDLRRGDNRFEITARNPETGKAAETPRSVDHHRPVPRRPGTNAQRPATGRGHDLRQRCDRGRRHDDERKNGRDHDPLPGRRGRSPGNGRTAHRRAERPGPERPGADRRTRRPRSTSPATGHSRSHRST